VGKNINLYVTINTGQLCGQPVPPPPLCRAEPSQPSGAGGSARAMAAGSPFHVGQAPARIEPGTLGSLEEENKTTSFT